MDLGRLRRLAPRRRYGTKIYDERICAMKDDGITPVALSEALAWALARTDRVIVRPRWTRVSTIGLVAVRCPTILRLTKMRSLF